MIEQLENKISELRFQLECLPYCEERSHLQSLIWSYEESLNEMYLILNMGI